MEESRMKQESDAKKAAGEGMDTDGRETHIYILTRFFSFKYSNVIVHF